MGSEKRRMHLWCFFFTHVIKYYWLRIFIFCFMHDCYQERMPHCWHILSSHFWQCLASNGCYCRSRSVLSKIERNLKSKHLFDKVLWTVLNSEEEAWTRGESSFIPFNGVSVFILMSSFTLDLSSSSLTLPSLPISLIHALQKGCFKYLHNRINSKQDLAIFI